jgi:hypothetical protein
MCVWGVDKKVKVSRLLFSFLSLYYMYISIKLTFIPSVMQQILSSFLMLYNANTPFTSSHNKNKLCFKQMKQPGCWVLGKIYRGKELGSCAVTDKLASSSDFFI